MVIKKEWLQHQLQHQPKRQLQENQRKINILIFTLSLSNHSTNSLIVVSEVSWDFSSSSIVSGNSMNSRLLNGKSVFGILIILVFLKMLSNIESFLNKVIEILWDLSSKSFLSEDSLNLLSSQESHLRNAVTISQDDTDLALGMTLLSELHDEFFNLLSAQFDV